MNQLEDCSWPNSSENFPMESGPLVGKENKERTNPGLTSKTKLNLILEKLVI